MSPFEGISDKEKDKLIEGLNCHIYNLNKNDEMIAFINTKNLIGIILEGEAKLVLNSYTGEEILLESYKTDSVFGTYLSDINNSLVKMYSMTKTKVLIIDYNVLISDLLLAKESYNRFIRNLFKILIIKSNEFNHRIRILTKKSIRDKLLEYFNIEYEKKKTKTFYLEMSLKNLADYLAINRSAMFREIKYLKEDNLISIYNKKVTILYE